MAYTPVTLKAWLTANPEYNKFPGTVSGKPMIYQAATAGSPLLTAESWFVFDWITEFPDMAQSPATADITTTGKVARSLIPIVPDAPSPSDLSVFLGEDTDAAVDAIEGIVAAYQTALSSGNKMYFANFMGTDKKSEIYEGAISWTSGFLGAFPDPVTTNVSVTPNLGAYHKYDKITNVGG